ncbi:threonylcarbamoyl-AMP synthase [Kordia sp. YSTF-M3]|uniref:L-threonylcarbamoyladenylate synthase n=1 Tax=Kordia aestuariivivens TaxID=2759037 RepID=A0ABR7Q541_9FLAO|nr:L-threonylcarbamoyladenylate synthase [Kordia aestuariivivens]MBC8753685.1 threonylcarbamoyl-AMP synthase [Kordia aestuariivivens]
MTEEINKAFDQLQSGNTILYPTDTIWGLGCDATNAAAVAKIYKLKNREESKALICLVSDIEMLKRYIEEIPVAAYKLLEIADRPTTIIYDNPVGIAKNLVAPDRTLAIRIPDDEFCQKLIRKFNRPIVSTSANIAGQLTPKSYKEISAEILKGVDYVVNLHNEKTTSKPSTIIQLRSNGEINIIRA